ncbi:MAG: ectoine synthase [Acidimicrobiales bacterium]|nr:ectoine synthase [Acidimicrobiales bacterium]MDG1876204.1 ectoine synthase [Acidimicrobiales bacterium]
MIIRSIEDLQATGRYAEKAGVFTSARYLLREDQVGFTMTQTSVASGTRQVLAYAHHIEANLVLDGEGVLTNLETGEAHELRPGVMYTFDGHERHQIEATTDLRIVCIFRPALLGSETHDETGAYPPAHIARWTSVTIDCHDVDIVADFYAALLGWEVTERGARWAQLRDPERGVGLNISAESNFVTPVWPPSEGDPQKQLHLEILVTDVEAAAAIVLTNGGSEAAWQPGDRDRDRLRVMLDPAGHPFCLFVMGE